MFKRTYLENKVKDKEPPVTTLKWRSNELYEKFKAVCLRKRLPMRTVFMDLAERIVEKETK